MLLAYLLLITGLTISAVAIYYSVVGLAAIFSAAIIPIVIMGTTLEVAKLVCASWLKANWERIPRLMKIYMTTAVVILMLITSMGIFGFLSKAHNDQNLVSGDVQSKIAIYDEKIKTAKDNIDANRKALKQMDEAVDQIMGRSSDEKGADKAVAIRRGQQKERARLQAEITAEQKIISQLSQERAPIAAEVRKVEAEVGPIKYIAKFIYGDDGANENMLEKAVTWIIITIVTVFDPLAVIMLLGAQMTFGWHRKGHDPLEVEEEQEIIPEETPTQPEDTKAVDPVEKLFPHNILRQDPHPVGWAFPKRADLTQYKVVEDADDELDIPVLENEEMWSQRVIDENPEPEEKPKKLIEVMNDEYVLIDGEKYYYNSLGGNDPKVKNSQDLIDKLIKSGEYYTITHTPTGVVLTDETGRSSEHALEERPGDYLEEPTYVQNEEQQTGGLWSRIQHPISEEEYIKKSEQNKKGNV